MNGSHTFQFSELVDWLEGRLSPDQARAVGERLETADTATQADLVWLQRFLHARQFVRFASPPARIRKALKERFAAHTQARKQPGPFQRWLATLIFDSRAQPATAGLRSVQPADDGPQQQLVYQTETVEVALTVHSTLPNKNFMVTGQIFPLGDTASHGFTVQLLRDVQEVDLAAADELGEFSFANLPPGDYEMIVSAADFEVVIPSLRLQ